MLLSRIASQKTSGAPFPSRRSQAAKLEEKPLKSRVTSAVASELLGRLFSGSRQTLLVRSSQPQAGPGDSQAIDR